MFLKKVLFGCFVLGFIGFSIAAPNFSFTPADGHDFLLYCPANYVDIYADGELNNYVTAEATFSYDNTAISIENGSFQGPFTSTRFVENIAANIYNVSAAVPSGTSTNGSQNLYRFRLNNLSNVETTDLDFINEDGSAPSYDPNSVDDGLLIQLNGASIDLVSGFNDVSYDFLRYPCVDDVEEPSVYNNITIPTDVANNGQLVGPQNVKMLVLDWKGSDEGHYWYGGNGNATILGNYVSAPSNVDNQNGVNSSTLNVRLNNNGVITYPSLTIHTYTGTETPDDNTWNSVDRGYWVEFDTTSLAVEKEVTITITGDDNPNYATVVNSMDQSYTFNEAVAPEMLMTTPTDGAENQTPTISPLIFSTTDAWAGVDTGSITIEIPVIMSGAEVLLTGHIYSGSDLIFVSNGGTSALGGAGGYDVTLVPQSDFPENQTITVIGYVMDKAGTSFTDTWTFTTRPSCDFYGCSEILDIYIMGGVNAPGSPFEFTGSLLVVTGTNVNSPYPYLTGNDNDILMCGFPWGGTALDGNITIFESDGVTVFTGLYTGHELYVTGLNFTYSNGVFTIEN